MSREIPIFFSTDDNYIPYLDVAIASLIRNASKRYRYRIVVLNTGLQSENMEKVKENECEGVRIEFYDISKSVEHIQSRFKNVYHFSIATYYRLFIASLFPQYEKIIYLDCDLVVLGDISELYEEELGEHILGAVCDRYVPYTREFRDYVQVALGVQADTYINAGVLVMNLREFRNHRIEEKFIKLLTEYEFDLLDPDQAYLNFLCQGKIRLLERKWNQVPDETAGAEEKSIVHYALYKKPWQYDDVVDGDVFWEYASNSIFYPQILRSKAAFGEREKAQKEAAVREMLGHAKIITDSDYTFSKLICRG